MGVSEPLPVFPAVLAVVAVFSPTTLLLPVFDRSVPFRFYAFIGVRLSLCAAAVLTFSISIFAANNYSHFQNLLVEALQ